MPLTAWVAIAIFSLGAILSFASVVVVARKTSKKNQIKVATSAPEDDPDIAGIVIGRYGKK